MSVQQALLQKLKDKSARIGVVGLGYVGLPLALRFSEVGFAVTGLDIDQGKVQALNAGKSYIAQIPAERVAKAAAKAFKASADFPRLPTATPSSSACPRPSGNTGNRM